MEMRDTTMDEIEYSVNTVVDLWGEPGSDDVAEVELEELVKRLEETGMNTVLLADGRVLTWETTEVSMTRYTLTVNGKSGEREYTTLGDPIEI